MPPAAAELCQNLPPPQSFQGPFVVVDRLMELFTHITLPDKLEGKKRARLRNRTLLFFTFLLTFELEIIQDMSLWKANVYHKRVHDFSDLF